MTRSNWGTRSSSVDEAPRPHVLNHTGSVKHFKIDDNACLSNNLGMPTGVPGSSCYQTCLLNALSWRRLLSKLLTLKQNRTSLATAGLEASLLCWSCVVISMNLWSGAQQLRPNPHNPKACLLQPKRHITCEEYRKG